MRKTSDFTILVAEDNPGVKALYVKVFEKEGYKVLTCDNAASIMAELNDGKVDLLLTDLEMPAANTLELFPFLKKEHPNLPVIVVTGHYVDLQQDFLSRGYKIAAFFNKPTDLAVLTAKARQILKIDSR